MSYSLLSLKYLLILTSLGKNIIVECIYRHPCMHPSEFNDMYLKNLLEYLSHDNKIIVLMGYFNTDLLKCDTEKDSANFLDSMCASFLLLYISTPFRIRPRSKTMINNTFSNNIKDSSIPGNIVTTISDHCPQCSVSSAAKFKQGTT